MSATDDLREALARCLGEVRVSVIGIDATLADLLQEDGLAIIAGRLAADAAAPILSELETLKAERTAAQALAERAGAERDEAWAEAEKAGRLETRQQVRAINAEARLAAALEHDAAAYLQAIQRSTTLPDRHRDAAALLLSGALALRHDMPLARSVTETEEGAGHGR